MLIFGTRSKVLDGPAFQGHNCPNCGQSAYHSFGAVRYFHIFWIPVFPFSKKLGAECSNCKHTVIGKEVPGPFPDAVRSEIFTGNRVFPLFVGSVLIAGLFVFGVYSANQDSARELAYVQNPVASDLYIMDFSQVFEDVDENYKYGVMRVENVDPSTIKLSISNYGYDRASIPASDLRRDMSGADFFAQETMSVSREYLVELKQSNVIRDVRR